MIEVKNLSKRYGNHLAVDNISFTIERGKIYGFLGPNGAGKSTTMNIITGCLSATNGQVLIGGYDIFEEAKEAKKLIGYLPEIPPVYLDSTVGEYLDFVAEAKGIRKADERLKQVENVITKTSIEEYRDRLIRHLSKGYRQRVGIAQAILGSPEVIILDEPTVGLDPSQIIEIRDLIKELGKDHTVILSSHILSEVQAVCDTILIISRGKLVACDTAENLEKMFSGTCTVRLSLEGTEEQFRNFLGGFGDGVSVRAEKTEDGISEVVLEKQTDDEKTFCREISAKAQETGLVVLQMATSRASLEDIFMELTAAPETDGTIPEERESFSGTDPMNTETGKGMDPMNTEINADFDGAETETNKEGGNQ